MARACCSSFAVGKRLAVCECKGGRGRWQEIQAFHTLGDCVTNACVIGVT